jgi:hypothetical protein
MPTQPRRRHFCLSASAPGQLASHVVIAFLGFGMTPQDQIHEQSLKGANGAKPAL